MILSGYPIDHWHITEYNSLRLEYPQLPLWEELSEDQKEKVREANREKHRFFEEIANSIKEETK